MIRDASGHRRGGPATAGGETRMGRTKMRDGTDEIHAVLSCQRTARQRATTACQRGETLTACGVQSRPPGAARSA
jgi:hypothetical protein